MLFLIVVKYILCVTLDYTLNLQEKLSFPPIDFCWFFLLDLQERVKKDILQEDITWNFEGSETYNQHGGLVILCSLTQALVVY